MNYLLLNINALTSQVCMSAHLAESIAMFEIHYVRFLNTWLSLS